ncbi:MAG: hypothetical protein Salg2KO_09010 [Salibacteraceae bacterium]
MTILNFFSKATPRQLELGRYLRSNWGLRTRSIYWYERALRHKSLVGTGQYQHEDCNERLELLGDAVLDTVVTEYLFRKYPHASEGELSKMRSRIVSRNALSKVGQRAGLGDFIESRISADDSNEKIIGNALEAWIGAMYVDKGFQKTKWSIENYLLVKYINLDRAINSSTDYKSHFIEWAQAQRVTFTFKTYTNDASQGFMCDLYIKSEVVASSHQRSKKLAEKGAAELACKQLNILSDYDQV